MESSRTSTYSKADLDEASTTNVTTTDEPAPLASAPSKFRMLPLVFALLVVVAACAASRYMLARQQEAAADALHDLLVWSSTVYLPGWTDNNPLADAIVAAGAITALVDLARGGGDGLAAATTERAAEMLCHLAANTAARGSILAMRGHEPLLALARSGTAAQQERAAFALGGLAFNHPEARSAIVRADGVKVLTLTMASPAGLGYFLGGRGYGSRCMRWVLRRVHRLAEVVS